MSYIETLSFEVLPHPPKADLIFLLIKFNGNQITVAASREQYDLLTQSEILQQKFYAA